MSGIETINLTKIFQKNNIVLRDMSFVINKGTIAFAAGQNGVGKTTWIRIALGLLEANVGCLKFGGLPTHRVRADISAVFDEPAIYPHLSGFNNILFLSGVLRPDKVLFTELKKILDLSDGFLKMRGKTYSLGQRRRIAVCAALIRKPKYLFLDEPTIGLDPVAWLMVKDAIIKMRDKGTTVVLTGQNMDYMSDLVNQVIIFGKQKILFDGSVLELVGLFPPTVIVETNRPDEICRRYMETEVKYTDENSAICKIGCKTREDAETMLRQIMRSDIPIAGIRISQKSLEESFVSIVRKEGENR